MDATLSLATLVQIGGAVGAIVGVIWTFRGMLSSLEKTLTAQNAALNTKIELLQQAQTNAQTTLEYRFSNIQGALEQQRAQLSQVQAQGDVNSRHIIELQSRATREP